MKNKISLLRNNLRTFIDVKENSEPCSFIIVNEELCDGYKRLLINYTGSENDQIPAYLLVPDTEGKKPAVLIHHQHNRERHLGKSEVCGIEGNPLQAFGVDLVKKGFVVLAPDSICFEDRRINLSGTEADDFADFLQHYNEMCYRLLKGTTLMKKVLEDADIGINVLRGLDFVDEGNIGVMGHSYGGNTVIFQAAFNKYISFACSSCAAASYEKKIEMNTGIEMAEVIPDFCNKFTIADLIKCAYIDSYLIVSADNDKYSIDADKVVESIDKSINDGRIVQKRYRGGHSLTRERYDFIVNWIECQVC